MSDQDIEAAIKEAQMYEAQDNLLKERLVFKNDVETLLIQIENGLVNHKKEMDKDIRKQIKNELASFKKLTKKFDYENASESDFQQVKEAKNRLEAIASSILS